jgi:RNA polymerase sigma-70 factor (ECF subfamily)
MATVQDSSTSLTLLQRLKDNLRDEAAWGRFVAKYLPKFLFWCRERGLQKADADDVAQTVLATLAEKLADFEYDASRGTFRAWLRTVTQHAISKWASRQPRDAGSGNTENVRQLQAVEAREDLARRLEEVFDQELLEAAMARVQARVEAHTWEAFRLTALEGLSGADAARQLRMPVMHLYVAKNRVQKMLQQELQGPLAAAELPPETEHTD